MKKKLVLLAPLAILAIVGLVAIGGAVVQALWNWLLPAIFGWRSISFWQALGLLALCRILFGGVSGHAGRRVRVDRGTGGYWGRMTPEERDRFRQRVRERFGFGPEPGASHVPEN